MTFYETININKLSALCRSMMKKAEMDITQWTKNIQSVASTHIGNQRNVVKAIAGLKELADLEKHIGGYEF